MADFSGTATINGVSVFTAGATLLDQPAAAAVMAQSEITARSLLPVSVSSPRRGVSPYRLEVVDVTGTKYCDLSDAVLDTARWVLSKTGSFSFQLSIASPFIAHIIPVEREVRLWLDDSIIFAGPIVRCETDGATVRVQCSELGWYFTKRFVGRANRQNYFTNPSFEGGLAGWSYGWVPIETDFNVDEISVRTGHSITGQRALYMETATSKPRYAFGINQFIVWEVDAAEDPIGTEWTAVAWVYIPDTTAASLSAEPWQSPNTLGYGFALSRFSTTETVNINGIDYPKPIAVSSIPFDANITRDKWIRLEIPLKQPPVAGEDEFVKVEVYCPFGSIFVDQVGLVRNEKLWFRDTDQALIAKGLVEHAQDTAYGKSDLNIDTSTPLTTIKRERVYLHDEHQQIGDLLDEFPSLHQGMDTDIVVTPSQRIFTTYYPRKGSRRKNLWLELGRNIVTYTLMVDGDSLANSVVVLGEGEGADREEGGYIDSSSLDSGLIIEKVFHATPGSAISSLGDQARRAVSRFSRQVYIVSVTVPWEGEMRSLRTGDWLPITLDNGWVNVEEDYRVIEIECTYRNGTAKLTVNPMREEFT